MASGDCLDEEVLLQFADGALDAGSSERVNTHLASCQDCRTVVSELARGGLASPPATPGEGPALAPLRRGMTLGRYLVLDCVGAGGMGVVYTAYDPELDRKVAVKLLREGAQGQARLLQEARAMARLSHPNVAAVYDVGTFEDRVFVAMELIPGQTLRAWLQAERSLPELLDVFLQAGRGLSAAHAAGIVHRDFKPDNVLVAPDGRTFVLDFGLARPSGVSAPLQELGVTAVAGPGLTEAGTVLGTPSYMAPEQRAGKTADARSDQYAYCVALHEALYGALPGQPAVRERQVPGLLRQALARGLSEDPAGRYPQLEQLLEQLALARQGNARRRGLVIGAVAAGALVLLALAGVRAKSGPALCAGGEAALQPSWSPAIAARIRETFSKSPVAGAAARAERAIKVLDAYGAQWLAARKDACEATRLRGEQSEELLDRRMVCLSARLAPLRATAALLAEGGPGVVERSVEAASALPAVHECADARGLLERLPPPSDPEVRKRIDQVTQDVAGARALFNVMRMKEALAKGKEAAQAARALGHPPLTADALLALGALQPLAGETGAAEVTLWDALSAAKASRDARLEAQVWVSLAAVTGNRLRKSVEGARIFAVAQAATAGLSDPGDLETRRLIVLGEFQDMTGQGGMAVESLRAALARREAERGKDAPELSGVLKSLGDSLLREQRLDEAEAVLRRSVALAEKDEVLRAKIDVPLASLADVLRNQGRFDEARPLLVRAVQLAKGSTGGILRAGNPMNLLGVLETQTKNYDAAAKLFEELAAGLKTLPEPNIYPAEPLTNLGQAYLDKGDLPKAQAALREALAVYERNTEPGDLTVLECRLSLAQALIQGKERAEAVKHLDIALKVMEGSNGSPGYLSKLRFATAQLLWDADHLRPRAVALARQAHEAAAPVDQPKIDAWLAAHKR